MQPLKRDIDAYVWEDRIRQSARLIVHYNDVGQLISTTFISSSNPRMMRDKDSFEYRLEEEELLPSIKSQITFNVLYAIIVSFPFPFNT